MKFGINALLYSSVFTNENIIIFKKLRELGFDGVEISLKEKGDLDYKRTLDELKNNGLECSSICGRFGGYLNRDIRGPNKEYIDNGMSYIKDCIDACANLECNLFVGPVYSSIGRANLETDEVKKEQWKTVVKNLKEVCKYAENKGIFIALEPISRFDTDFINTCTQAINLIKDVGSNMLKIHLDSFHMNIEEKSSKQAILDAGELLYHFHASENDRGAPGTGQVHWVEIAKALKDIKYDRYIVIESFTPEVKILAKALSIWRPTEKNGDVLAEKGLRFLKELFG